MGCGHGEGVSQDRLGSWRQRHSPSLPLLQVSEVPREGSLEGLRETGEGDRGSFVHPFIHSAAILWIAAQPNMATNIEPVATWEEAHLLPYFCQGQGRHLKGGALGTGLERESHFSKQY